MGKLYIVPEFVFLTIAKEDILNVSGEGESYIDKQDNYVEDDFLPLT